MKIADNGVDHASAPADYAELFEKYYQYVVTIVRRMGIWPVHAEDVACEILLRFYERDFLSKFDPTMVFEYEGQERPARFKSFLTKFVMTYVRGHYDKQQRRADREVLLCDRPIGNGTDTWINLFGDTVDAVDADVIEALSENELVTRLREYIKTVPRRSKYDTCDLVALFDAVVKQIHTDGKYNITALRGVFGISSTAMHSWMWWLRANIATALDRPVPAKRFRATPQ